MPRREPMREARTGPSDAVREWLTQRTRELADGGCHIVRANVWGGDDGTVTGEVIYAAVLADPPSDAGTEPLP